MDVIYGGLGISKRKKEKKNFIVFFFFQFLVIKNLDLDPEQDPHLDPDSINLDP